MQTVWVAWEKVCDSRDECELGIKYIRLFNVALLGKWIWRLQPMEDELWKEILESKYGEKPKKWGK